MRKIFLDCGSHDGRSVDLFRRLYADAYEYEIFCFEANPLLRHHYPIEGAKFIDRAVWIHNGTIDFYCCGEGEASTIDPFKGRAYRKITVPCLDLGQWIKHRVGPRDHLVLKLDIEGAEYTVLPAMVRDGSIARVKQLFAELHNYKCNRGRRDDAEIIESLAANGLRMHVWSAEARPGAEKRQYPHPDDNPVWPRLPGDPPALVARTHQRVLDVAPGLAADVRPHSVALRA